jgi:hypothetical protein
MTADQAPLTPRSRLLAPGRGRVARHVRTTASSPRGVAQAAVAASVVRPLEAPSVGALTPEITLHSSPGVEGETSGAADAGGRLLLDRPPSLKAPEAPGGSRTSLVCQHVVVVLDHIRVLRRVDQRVVLFGGLLAVVAPAEPAERSPEVHLRPLPGASQREQPSGWQKVGSGGRVALTCRPIRASESRRLPALGLCALALRKIRTLRLEDAERSARLGGYPRRDRASQMAHAAKPQPRSAGRSCDRSSGR